MDTILYINPPLGIYCPGFTFNSEAITHGSHEAASTTLASWLQSSTSIPIPTVLCIYCSEFRGLSTWKIIYTPYTRTDRTMPPQLLRNGCIPGGRCIQNFKMHVGLNQDHLRKGCICLRPMHCVSSCLYSRYVLDVYASKIVADGRLSLYLYPLWSLVVPYIVYSHVQYSTLYTTICPLAILTVQPNTMNKMNIHATVLRCIFRAVNYCLRMHPLY